MNTYNYLLRNHLKYPEIPLCIQKGIHDKAFHTHTHDFGELVVVTEGAAVHTVLDKRYNIREGDVFVINGPVAHGFEETDKLRTLNIMYDYHNPIFDKPALRALAGYQSLFTIGPKLRGKENFKSWANLSGQKREITKQLVSSLYDEYQNGHDGYREMLVALLQQLIIHLSRCYGTFTQADHPRLMPLARAIAYMEDNYQNVDIKLNDIAREACVGARQLDRLFNQYMANPPIQYLTEVRLQRAAELLRYQSDIRIADVAARSGFSDPNYFTRKFKKCFAVSPRDYRKGVAPNS